jgi:translation initiation factor IF-2
VEQEQTQDRAAAKRQRKKEQAAAQKHAPATPVLIPEFISVDSLAKLLKVRSEQFSRMLDTLGFGDLPYDHILNGETAGLIAMEYNFAPMIDASETKDLRARPPAEDPTQLPPRPPVVTIMGHVDHGKTTILDYLRKSSIAAGEFGGITQHIGAFSVPMSSGKTITFLDTPGHAAFLKMRQRGANVTDIVVLVVAADDSVKPQTIEAIKHAKAAEVPMIVAVNKIDKEEANVERVKQDLARHDVEVEDFGGDTQVVPLSGKTGAGMADLEESLVTLSEILDMRAERDGNVEGWIIEATTKSSGRVATMLVKRGTIQPGDVVVAGTTWARIRTLRNEGGVEIDAAGPGMPVEVDGWREQPVAGDEVLQAASESAAKDVIDFRISRAETLKMATDMDAVNEARRIEQERRDRAEALAQAELAGLPTPDADDTSGPQPSGIKEVSFIVKGDVSGSVEAVINSVAALGNEEVRARVLRSGVGPVSEFDIEHAAAAQGHVIAFNVPLDGQMRRMAEANGVGVIERNIIYRLVDDVKAKLSAQLTPLVTQRVTGEAEVAQIFSINLKSRKFKPIAGCKVRNGVVTRNARVRVLRGTETIFDGTAIRLILS